MPLIDHITLSVTTYNPWRPFPGGGTHIGGWLDNLLRLDIVNQVFIVDMRDGDIRLGANFDEENPYGGTDDERIEIIPWLNDPPYADPTRQPILDRAKNDWVLFIEDDERLSEGMIRFLNSLSEQDPHPEREWSAITFLREDYIWYNGLWRFCPANGNDPQMRLVDRNKTKWPGKPHTIPEVDGLRLTINRSDVAILHYRSYDKIVQECSRCNDMFADMPQIVAMQSAYMERVRQLMGISEKDVR